MLNWEDIRAVFNNYSIYHRQKSYILRVVWKLTLFTCVLKVIWSCVMGTADRRDSLQRRGLLCHHLGCWQQQSSPSCSLHLPRWLQNPHEANMVIVDHVLCLVAPSITQDYPNVQLKKEHSYCYHLTICPLPRSFVDSRQGKPRNRPSFRQILLHLDIASADVLGAPQETYFKSQVGTVLQNTMTCTLFCF